MIDRRTILKGLLAIPAVAAAGGLATALLSYLRPTLKPLAFPGPEIPLSEPYVAVTLAELPRDWDVKQFDYTQESVEYTARGRQSVRIPGYVLRIPNGSVAPEVGGAGDARRGYGVFIWQGETYSLMVNSRICPHLGCVFNYAPPAVVCSDYNYCGAKNNHYACPCHLSVYNPVETQVTSGGLELPGRVVSGPAPRPPFPFDFDVRDGQVVVFGYGNG